ncbi:hypothetical protein [Mesorhizobium sp. KR1-2]|uniref:hypothetical protein n=1 Tax=Mesorhizobium sp. KR1-2 TaxID=3156609 RepID=UPI0032B5E567
MPSYLTFANMSLIETLLAELRVPGLRRDFDRETLATRVLIQHIERGKTDEIELRGVLSRHLSPNGKIAHSSSLWRFFCVSG